MFKGKEIVRLMVIGALCCALMIAAISAYLMVSSRQHLKSQADKMSESLAEAIAVNLNTSFDNITGFLKETPAIPLSMDVWKILTDTKRVMGFFTGCAFSVYNCDYAVELDEGEIFVGYARGDKGLSMEDFPLEMFRGQGGTHHRERPGDRRGYPGQGGHLHRAVPGHRRAHRGPGDDPDPDHRRHRPGRRLERSLQRRQEQHGQEAGGRIGHHLPGDCWPCPSW